MEDYSYGRHAADGGSQTPPEARQTDQAYTQQPAQTYEAQQTTQTNDAQQAYAAQQARQAQAQQAQAQQQAYAAQHARQTYSYTQSQQPAAVQEPQDSRGKRSGHPFLAALFGGLIGAAAMFGGLYATDNLGGTTYVTQEVVQSGSAQENMSSAGQTITIDATNATADIAQAVAKKALPSVVSIYMTTSQGSGVGSGVILDADGDVLTNYHVVEGAQTITVTIDDVNYVGEVVGYDESSDLAVVKVDLEGASVTPIEVGDSDALVVGDWVMAIGSPYGLDQSVSTGIVSSLYRSTMMTSTNGNTIYANLIQTDAAINPGNSGGALVNSQGQLVGINSIIQSTTGSSIGLGFAIPGNYAVEVANEIIAGETVLHPYIGLSLQTVTAQNAQRYGLSVNQGAYVAYVADGGPAQAAGIEQGDIITRVGRDSITSADALILAIRSHKIGDTVSVTFMRGDQEMTADVTLGSDEPLQQQSSDYGLGLGGLGNGGSSGGYGGGYGDNSNGG